MTVELGRGTRRMLLRRGLWLEYATLAWNVAGVVVLVSAAVTTGSVAFAGARVARKLLEPEAKPGAGACVAARCAQCRLGRI